MCVWKLLFCKQIRQSSDVYVYPFTLLSSSLFVIPSPLFFYHFSLLPIPFAPSSPFSLLASPSPFSRLSSIFSLSLTLLPSPVLLVPYTFSLLLLLSVLLVILLSSPFSFLHSPFSLFHFSFSLIFDFPFPLLVFPARLPSSLSLFSFLLSRFHFSLFYLLLSYLPSPFFLGVYSYTCLATIPYTVHSRVQRFFWQTVALKKLVKSASMI